MILYLVFFLCVTGTLHASPRITKLEKYDKSPQNLELINPYNSNNRRYNQGGHYNSNISPSREDPRLFYLSDSYRQQKNTNDEVSFVYPGEKELRAGEDHKLRSLPLRANKQEALSCIKCPHDRTLVAKAGSKKVLIQKPRVFSCRGNVSKKIKFESLYGPKFGTLLEKGSYVIVGRITYKNNTLRYCNMKVEVVIQFCNIPKQLVANCNGPKNICQFSCKDPKYDLRGPKFLFCDHVRGWSGTLPSCNVSTWCQPPPLPEQGLISCKAGHSNKLMEGSKCRVKCSQGWHPGKFVTTFCRRGNWTHNLTCLPN